MPPLHLYAESINTLTSHPFPMGSSPTCLRATKVSVECLQEFHSEAS